MPVTYKKEDLELRQVKKKLLSKIKQLQGAQSDIEVKIGEIEIKIEEKEIKIEG